MNTLETFGPLLAVFAGLIGLGAWWHWRSKRKEEQAYADGLTALANAVGGRVAGPEDVTAWSAGLLPPMKSETDGFSGWIGTVRPPRFETALDFRRGHWSVRLTEASMERANSSSSSVRYEHRVDVATSLVPPMKISRRIHVDHLGRPLRPDRIQDAGRTAEAPVTVAQEQRQWLRVGLPEPLAKEFTVFATDPAAAARVFTPQVVAWMLEQAGPLPFESVMPLMLTFEAGLVYATTRDRIKPDPVLAQVDVILGLLDRMGIAPATA